MHVFSLSLFFKKLHIIELLDLKNESPLKSHLLETSSVNSFTYELLVVLLHMLYA